MNEVTTLSADWIAPVAVPPIPNGIISFADRQLTYVGPADGRPIDEHFGDAIILPGLVNAHTHLDLTGAAGKTPPCLPFTEWLRSVIDFRRTSNDVAKDIKRGAEMCLAAGTTLVFDIAGVPESRQEGRVAPFFRIAFYELIGLTPDRCNQAIADCQSNGAICVSPHAPYSLNKSGFEFVVKHSAIVSIHLAETREEQELLEHHSGPFVEFLQSLGAWYPAGLVSSWADILNDLKDKHALIVHGNYLDPEVPLSKKNTLVYCPRTHAAFGHPPHPFRRFLDRGVRVVLGTDSLASNPDLSVLNEARFVARKYPDFDESTILHMITDWPAQAMMFGDLCGSLEPGLYADLCVVEMPPTSHPLTSLFQNDAPIRAVFFAGDRVI